MTSYEFEKAAKNAAIKVLKDNEDIDLSIEDLQFVWFTHVLGHKKCLLYSQLIGDRYVEVTYNCYKDEMYVDVYRKQLNVKIGGTEFDYTGSASSKTDLLAAAMRLRHFINDECDTGTTTLIVAPNGEELTTDWGYFEEGLDEITRYATRENDNE